MTDASLKTGHFESLPFGYFAFSFVQWSSPPFWHSEHGNPRGHPIHFYDFFREPTHLFEVSWDPEIQWVVDENSQSMGSHAGSLRVILMEVEFKMAFQGAYAIHFHVRYVSLQGVFSFHLYETNPTVHSLQRDDGFFRCRPQRLENSQARTLLGALLALLLGTRASLLVTRALLQATSSDALAPWTSRILYETRWVGLGKCPRHSS